MKVLLVVACLCVASPLAAQSVLLADVQAERAKIPSATVSGAQIGQILNAVALKHVNEGWRLMKKSSGNHCSQPITGIAISCDILLHPPSGHWVDALSDAEGDGTGVAAPTWGDHANGDMAQQLLPVDTSGSPVPVPVPVPVPPPAAIDFSPVTSYIERTYLDLKAEAAASAARDTALAVKVQAVYDKPSLVEDILKSPYLYTILGSILAGRYVIPDK